MQPADLAALVLAAGEGRRLRPLTTLRPKPLCPVNNVALIDLALDEVTRLLGAVGPDRVAVNAHHLAERVVTHVGGRAHLSVETPVALGTAGAIGHLGQWLDGRPVLVRNCDVWRGGDVPAEFVTDWDGRHPRLLVVDSTGTSQRADFGGRWRYAGLSLLAWSDASALAAAPSGLYETVWAQAEAAGRLDLVPSTAVFIDCGTPSDYLRANLTASGGQSVVGPGATVDGEVVRSVVWDGAVVRRGERLVEAIRAGTDVTVPAPQDAPPP